MPAARLHSSAACDAMRAARRPAWVRDRAADSPIPTRQAPSTAVALRDTSALLPLPTSKPPRGVESIQGIRPEIQQAIAGAVDNCLTATHLPLPGRRQVREPVAMPASN